MRHLLPLKEILSSWRRCLEEGMSSKSPFPSLIIDERALLTRLKEKGMFIQVFMNCVKGLEGLITCEHAFLLLDADGVLLKKKHG